MTQLLFLCGGGNNVYAEQVAGKQEYKLAFCLANQIQFLLIEIILYLPYPLKIL